MKYYCNICKTEFKFTDNAYIDNYCNICGCNDDLIPIPDYESPAQYKERTGKPHPDNGLVFYRHVFDGEVGKWETGAYLHTVVYSATEGVDDIVIADPPVPPPEDWRPEEEKS